MCRSPIRNKAAGHDVPCGQCLHCMINKKREWSTRIILEAQCHAKASFVTLTYAEQHLVFGATGAPILYYPDVQRFFQRLRDQIGPFRYYAVGEYGEKSQRPHYHLAMFGVDGVHTSNLHHAWSDDKGQLGFVDVGTLTLDSAQYIAGYVTKKMTKPDDPRLDGRPPEHSEMSKGIGRPFVEHLIAHHDARLRRYLKDTGDVPTSLMFQGRDLPLGRYLVGKLRKHYGLDTEEIKKSKRWKARFFMQILQGAQENSKACKDSPPLVSWHESRQRMSNKEARHALYKKEKKL